MKKALTILACLLCLSLLSVGQEEENKPLNIGINIKGFYPGIEICTEFPVFSRTLLQTSIGFNELYYNKMRYGNSELIFRFRHFSTTQYSGFNYGGYIKLKKSHYSLYADTADIHDGSIHETAIYYAGPGVHAGYRFCLGKKKRFIIEPFVAAGVNIALISDDINILQVDFSKLYRDVEPDVQAGLGLYWSF